MQIAEIVIRVGFEGGAAAVFSVSPRGKLSPCNGDGIHCSAEGWYRASQALADLGMTPPSPDTSAPHGDAEGRVGICWPWQEDDRETVAEGDARYYQPR